MPSTSKSRRFPREQNGWDRWFFFNPTRNPYTSMRIPPYEGINRMVKLYVIGGKLPLFTQEASFMESLSMGEWIVRPFSRRNPSNAGDFYLPVCPSIEQITISSNSNFTRELNSAINRWRRKIIRYFPLKGTLSLNFPPPNFTSEKFTTSALTTPLKTYPSVRYPRNNDD